MTKNETLQIMAILRVAYPAYYARQSAGDIDAAVRVWHDMFSGDDARLVSAAVKAYINADTKGFPPSIGQVRDKINLLTNPQGMTEQEAWNMIRKAISNSGYRAAEEFEKLPPMLQRMVGSPNQLREWGMMDIGELQTVVASNFMRSYRVREKSEREVEALPESVKVVMLELSERYMLHDGSEPAKKAPRYDFDELQRKAWKSLHDSGRGTSDEQHQDSGAGYPAV